MCIYTNHPTNMHAYASTYTGHYFGVCIAHNLLVRLFLFHILFILMLLVNHSLTNRKQSRWYLVFVGNCWYFVQGIHRNTDVVQTLSLSYEAQTLVTLPLAQLYLIYIT